MSDSVIQNLFSYLSKFDKNSVEANLLEMENKVGNGDGVLIKAEFQRSVLNDWNLIETNEWNNWNGEKTDKQDLIDAWWAKMDVNNSALRNDINTKYKEYNTLSNKDLTALEETADGFDWVTARENTIPANIKDLRDKVREDIKKRMGGKQECEEFVSKNLGYDVYAHVNDLKNEEELEAYKAEVFEWINEYHNVTARNEALKYINEIINTNKDLVIKYFGEDYANAISNKTQEELSTALKKLEDDVCREAVKQRIRDILNMGVINKQQEGSGWGFQAQATYDSTYKELVQKYFGEDYNNSIEKWEVDRIKTALANLETALSDIEEEKTARTDVSLTWPKETSVYCKKGPQNINLPGYGLVGAPSQDGRRRPSKPVSVHYQLRDIEAPKGVNVSLNGTTITVEGAQEPGTITVVVRAYDKNNTLIGSPKTLTITVKEEEIKEDDFTFEDNTDWGTASCPFGGSVTFKLAPDIKAKDRTDMKYYNVTYAPTTEGFKVDNDGVVTVNGDVPGDINVSIDVSVNGVVIGTITKTISVLKNREDAYNSALDGLEDIVAYDLKDIKGGQEKIDTTIRSITDGEYIWGVTDPKSRNVYDRLYNTIENRIGADLKALGIDISILLRTAWRMAQSGFKVDELKKIDTVTFVRKVIEKIELIIKNVKEHPEYLKLLNEDPLQTDNNLREGLLNCDDGTLMSNSTKWNQTKEQLWLRLKNKYDYLTESVIKTLLTKAIGQVEAIYRSGLNLNVPIGNAVLEVLNRFEILLYDEYFGEEP